MPVCPRLSYMLARLHSRRMLSAAILGAIAITAAVDIVTRRYCNELVVPLVWPIKPSQVDVVQIQAGSASPFVGFYHRSLLVEGYFNNRIDPTQLTEQQRQQPAVSPPSWSSHATLAAEDPQSAPFYQGAAFGFPFRSSTREAVLGSLAPPAAGTHLRLFGLNPAIATTDAYGIHINRLNTRPALANLTLYALLILIPAAAIELLRARRRQRRGHCLWCNYDLTGIPTAPASTSATPPRCPECGHANAG